MPIPLVMTAAVAIAQQFLPALVGKLESSGGRALAETVVTAAAAAAGVSPMTPAAQMIARITADPAAADELQRELQMIDREVYTAEIADRDRARVHQRESGSDGRTRGNWMIIGVCVGLVACVLGAFWAASRGGQVDAGVSALVATVAGALLKMLSDAFAFEFGSSRGSRDKDLILADQTREIAAAGEQNTKGVLQAIREAQDRIPEVAARVATATNNAVMTGAAAATAAAEAAVKPRDFVGQLVRGEV
jgi:hypothetical protein